MFHTSPKLTSGPPRITSPGRAFFVQVAVPMRLLMLADFAGVISRMMISGQCDKRTLLGAFLAEVVLI